MTDTAGLAMATGTAVGFGEPAVAAEDGRRGVRVRRRVPARLAIVGWVVGLMFGVLTVVNLASQHALLAEVDELVTETLARESGEFARFAVAGVDPDTGLPFADDGALLASHLDRQSPDDDEIVFGVLAADRAAITVLRQPGAPPWDASADAPTRGAILDDPVAAGSIDTPAGEMRWEKRPAGTTGWFVAGYFIDRDRADVRDSMRTLVLYSLLGLALAGVGAWFVSGRIMAPVRLVRSVAAEITERDLTRRIAVDGHDDMAALARQFNGMLDRLQEAFGAQNRFIDAAAHELRTPLTIVRGNLELLGLQAVGDDPQERAEVVALATDELDRMARIVADLLTLSRSQRPDFLRRRPVSVAELTCDLADEAARLAPRRWTVGDVGEGRADLDPHQLVPALLHLVRNAVHHTGDGDEIRISSSVEGGVARFRVSDRGPGVSPAAAATIFDRFARGGSARARATGTGAGLGLAVVRAVAEAHGGTARLDPAPGPGATFVVEIPCG
ncbi:HAMP domain-containing sensor histidine kinase [Pseudonocardia sp.]|uniref:sensor histidine kinase n=1 Tax=Pseudonocardia sp. TaxID=60912 RepID=UPI002614A784|nr:HAMP domain-containing sensor histidine kinase [Pseudonocardia sp.]